MNPFLASMLFSSKLGKILNKYCQEQTTTRNNPKVIKALVISDNILSPCSIDPLIEAYTNSPAIIAYKIKVKNDLYLLKAV